MRIHVLRSVSVEEVLKRGHERLHHRGILTVGITDSAAGSGCAAASTLNGRNRSVLTRDLADIISVIR